MLTVRGIYKAAVKQLLQLLAQLYIAAVFEIPGYSAGEKSHFISTVFVCGLIDIFVVSGYKTSIAPTLQKESLIIFLDYFLPLLISSEKKMI